MHHTFFRSRRPLFLILGATLVILLGAVPAKAQCMLTAWMGGGYCYDWGNMFSGKTVRIYSSGGRGVEAQTPFGVMYGQWVAPGDAVLDAGDQVICCYGRRSTGLQYGVCKVCGSGTHLKSFSPERLLGRRLLELFVDAAAV